MSEFWGHPLTVPDETGIGIPFVDALRRGGMRLAPYQITSNAAKKHLVDSLAQRISKGWIEYPEWPEMLEELNLFEAKQSSAPGSTVVKFGAPSGKNDDIVLSAALATQVLPKRASLVVPQQSLEDLRQKGPWEDLE